MAVPRTAHGGRLRAGRRNIETHPSRCITLLGGGIFDSPTRTTTTPRARSPPSRPVQQPMAQALPSLPPMNAALPRDMIDTRSGVPASGLRNHWYPALASWRLRKAPKAVRLLGEDIVLFRDGGRVHALRDRCPHRGAKLSLGRCLYPGSGTISCPYHGWTFEGGTGRCVAKLVEGPDAPMPRQAAVQAYAVRVHAGVVWVFVGDIEPVPLDDDLPEPLARTDAWHAISNWRTYRCNWRLLIDNLSHDQHAPYLHRHAPELMLQPVFPHAGRITAEPLPDGKGMGHASAGGVSSAVYPGLGRFPPRREWYRVLKPTGRGKEIDPSALQAGSAAVRFRHVTRLPSVALIGRPSGDFYTCRWVVPIDEDRCLLYTFNLDRRRGWLRGLADRAGWLLWWSWAHDWLFSDQDKRVVESITPGSELLSRTDVGVIAWRRFSAAHAHTPAAAKPAAQETAP